MPHMASRSTAGHSYTPSNNGHLRKVQSASAAKVSRLDSNNSAGHSRHRAGSGARKTGTKSDEVLSVEQPRASTAKLKGRLGHLVAAIAEAHSSSSTTYVDGSSSGSHEPSRWHNTAWVSANSSLDSIEMHMCSKCDRMYSNMDELEHHQSLCLD